MKKLLMTAVLLTLPLGALPIHADCPTGQNTQKTMPVKKTVVIRTAQTTMVQEPFWHDLHWFE